MVYEAGPGERYRDVDISDIRYHSPEVGEFRSLVCRGERGLQVGETDTLHQLYYYFVS